MFFRFQGGPNSTTLTEFDQNHHYLWCLNHSSAVRREAMRHSAKKGQGSVVAAVISAEPSTKNGELLEAASSSLSETYSSVLPEDTIQGDEMAIDQNSVLGTDPQSPKGQMERIVETEDQSIAERELDQNISRENKLFSKTNASTTQKLSVSLNMEATTFESSSPVASSDQSGKHVFAIKCIIVWPKMRSRLLEVTILYFNLFSRLVVVNLASLSLDFSPFYRKY